MSHKVKPGQTVKILRLEIAVPADSDPSEIADEISALLTECGTAKETSNILDWRYKINPVEAGEHLVYLDEKEPVGEGDVFEIRDHDEHIEENDE